MSFSENRARRHSHTSEMKRKMRCALIKQLRIFRALHKSWLLTCFLLSHFTSTNDRIVRRSHLKSKKNTSFFHAVWSRTLQWNRKCVPKHHQQTVFDMRNVPLRTQLCFLWFIGHLLHRRDPHWYCIKCLTAKYSEHKPHSDSGRMFSTEIRSQ